MDTGGGGRESNIHLIPYIIHTVLYVLNTYAALSRHSRSRHHQLTRSTHSRLSRPPPPHSQDEGHVPGGEEPAEFPGAAVGEVGGELVRGGGAALLHCAGHAHHAAGALEVLADVLPAEAARQRTRTQDLSKQHQQVGRNCLTLRLIVEVEEELLLIIQRGNLQKLYKVLLLSSINISSGSIRSIPRW